MPANRTVLITGCSDNGLGSALALAFHRTGNFRVFATARNVSKLKNVIAAGMETIQLDTLSDASIAAAVAKVSDLTGGSLDMLINNAGAGYSMPVTDMDLAEAKRLFDLNVWSPIVVSRAFIPLLMRSTANGPDSTGVLVNNTSVASLVAGSLPLQGAYNASKAAAASFTEAMRLELAPFGIQVVNLMTGSVNSNFHENLPEVKLPRDSIYQIAAEAVVKKMEGGDAKEGGVSTEAWAASVVASLSKKRPTYWIWSGGFSRLIRIASLLPVGWFDSLAKKMSALDVVEQKVKQQGGPASIAKKLS